MILYFADITAGLGHQNSLYWKQRTGQSDNCLGKICTGPSVTVGYPLNMQVVIVVEGT